MFNMDKVDFDMYPSAIKVENNSDLAWQAKTENEAVANIPEKCASVWTALSQVRQDLFFGCVVYYL